MRISDWSSDVCSSDLPGAVRLDNAGFDIAEIGVDDEIADALGIDRAADLAEPLLILPGEILAQRIGDQRGDAGAVAQPDQPIARHATGIAGPADIAAAHHPPTGRISRTGGEPARPGRHARMELEETLWG